MAEKYVKEVKTQSGKTKYRAEVWYQGKFYTSKTFDSRTIAVSFKERQYKEAVAGRLLPAAERRQQRTVQSSLLHPMSHWAELFIAESANELGKSRLNEYRLVGELTADKSLKDFQGKTGAQLLKTLKKQWEGEPRLKCCPSRGRNASEERRLKPATVRLRLTALLRLIEFAHCHLPEEAEFVPPTLKLVKFKLPPSYATPRTVEPSDEEYSRLLRHFGEGSEFGQLLQVIDETGCRLGEILRAHASQVDLFWSEDSIMGGCLTLNKHKTAHQTNQPRYIPLSLKAATLLARRIELQGTKPLFAGLGPTDKVCKTFDDARAELGISDLLIKDFRRAFINRNKGCISQLDMLKIVGQSSLLDLSKPSASDAAIQDAVGHTSSKTTAGYSVPDMQYLSKVFTRTSRWGRVCGGPSTLPMSTDDAEVEALQLSSSSTPVEHELREDVANLLKRISSAAAKTSAAGSSETVVDRLAESKQGSKQQRPALRVFKSRRR